MKCDLSCLTLIALTALAFVPANSAQADTRHDVQSCKESLSERGLFKTSEHRLKFKHTKGNTRKRSVHFKLTNKEENTRFDVVCQLHKSDVVDIKLTPRN